MPISRLLSGCSSEAVPQLDCASELDSFAHSVSHDLRAPLRAVDAFVQILIDDFGGEIPADAVLTLLRAHLRHRQPARRRLATIPKVQSRGMVRLATMSNFATIEIAMLMKIMEG